MGGRGSEISSWFHLKTRERGGQESSRETKKWPERWEGAQQSREKDVLRKRAWPAAESTAEKSGVSLVPWEDMGKSQVSAPGPIGPILGGVQAGAVVLPSALGEACPPGRKKERKIGKSLSRVRLFGTPWAVAYQVPSSMEFAR